jgi:omega-amidase
MKIALYSADMSWENIVKNLSSYDLFLQKLKRKDEIPDLIIFPELFTTGFTVSGDIYELSDGASLRWMNEVAGKYNMAIVGSVPLKEGKNIYNRAYFVYPDGKEVYYNKRHLFSYGKENRTYTKGDQRVVFSYHGFNISINICYDLRFPVWSRNIRSEYDIMINIANWPSTRSSVLEPLCKARAIENQSFFAFVNRSGSDVLSSYNGEHYLIDYLGNNISGKAFDDSSTLYEINKEGLLRYRDKFRAWEDADHFDLLMD